MVAVCKEWILNQSTFLENLMLICKPSSVKIVVYLKPHKWWEEGRFSLTALPPNSSSLIDTLVNHLNFNQPFYPTFSFSTIQI